MPKACNFIKNETLTQLFSCKFYKMFKNNFFRAPPAAAYDSLQMESPKGSLQKSCSQLFLQNSKEDRVSEYKFIDLFVPYAPFLSPLKT